MESPPSQVQRTRVLKLQPNCCTECVRKVKRAMLKVEGVHSIKIDANEGTIQVQTDIDPQLLIAIAAKVGKRAELLWEPLPDSSVNVSTATPPPVTTPSTNLANHRQVQVSNFDGFEQTVHLQDLVDKNASGIKHMEIIDKRVVKITFNDDPNGNQLRDSVSPIAPSSDSKSSIGSGGEASGSGGCGNVEVVPAAAEALSSIPAEINDAPCNSKPAGAPVANVNCSSGGNSCRVM